MNFKKQIFNMAKQDCKTLVFPEACFSDAVMSAIKIITTKHLAKVILIGDPNVMFVKYNSFEDDFLKIIDPKTSELRELVAKKFSELIEKNELNCDRNAEVLTDDPYYFATALLLLNYADGLVSGTESVSSKTYLPALQILSKPLQKSVSSGVLYIGKNRFLNRPLLIADYVLNENPSEKDLVECAKCCVDFWKMLFIQEPKVAFLSYSTNICSDGGVSPQKMRKATTMFKNKFSDVVCDGEMQFDCAIVKKNQEKKFPDSKIKGDANILIVPDNNSGNILGKSLQYIGGLTRIGPVGFAFSKPVSNVSRNATVNEIVLTSVITAIQAQV